MEEWKQAYQKLQNGSDVRGVALQAVENEPVSLTEEIVRNIAMAFADYVAEKKGVACGCLRIGIGNDSRLSALQLKQGGINGLSRKGCKVFDCGLTSTPSMFMSTVLNGFEYDAAIMITASHLPSNRNGLKFFTREGGLEKTDIKRILEMAAVMSRMQYEAEFYRAEKVELVSSYTAYLQELICKEVNADDYGQPLKGLHIVIDASNGVGGYFRNVLEPLGASTEGSICMNPDGTFPNHVPNPEDQKAMNMLKKAVLNAKADLGVIFDTDGDRAAVVFADGQEVNKDAVIALMAAILSEEFPNTTIVTDSVTSVHLTEFLEKKLRMKHHRFKRGYKNVINEAIRLNRAGEESHLAIETSGHGAVKENFFLDDGAYMSVRIIACLAKCREKGRDLKELIADLGKPAESREVRLRIKDQNYEKYGQEVLEQFKVFAEREEKFHVAEPNYEGVRIHFKDDEVTGWMLMRISLHDPMIAINFESDRKKGIAVMISRIQPFLDRFPKLGAAD